MRRDFVAVRCLERYLRHELKGLAIARQRRLACKLSTSRVTGCFSAVKAEGSRTTHTYAHSTATALTAARSTTSRSATCRRTTRTTTGSTTSYLLINCDLFVGLSDIPGNALGVLPTWIETLALALIERPGAGEVWRSSMRSQSKH